MSKEFIWYLMVVTLMKKLCGCGLKKENAIVREQHRQGQRECHHLVRILSSD